MSEALLLGIITPIAGLISALILKVWESIAKGKAQKLEDDKSLKDSYREDRDAAIERERAAKAEAEKWRMDYMELYQNFYLLRLAHAQATQDVTAMNTSSLGIAPHERRGSQSPFDNEENA